MFLQIVNLILDVATGLVGGACLMRLVMQWQRLPFQNPIGRFVFAVTDWLVMPLEAHIARSRSIGHVQLGGSLADEVEPFAGDVGLGRRTSRTAGCFDCQPFWGASLAGLWLERHYFAVCHSCLGFSPTAAA